MPQDSITLVLDHLAGDLLQNPNLKDCITAEGQEIYTLLEGNHALPDQCEIRLFVPSQGITLQEGSGGAVHADWGVLGAPRLTVSWEEPSPPSAAIITRGKISTCSKEFSLCRLHPRRRKRHGSRIIQDTLRK